MFARFSLKGVVIKFLPRGFKHLCHKIFVNVSQVGFKFVGQESVVNNIFGVRFVIWFRWQI